MLKTIRQHNFLTTPFVAEKKWTLENVLNDDLVLLEQSASVQDIPVAMEYLDYSNNTAFLERDCNIALEQQEEDQVHYREGEKKVGLFFPDSEDQNLDGTYKRLVYSQIKEAFYNNNRKNPFEIFGIENIDFQLSKTNLYLSEFFREFLLPQNTFGDKVVPGTVKLQDNTIDDNVVIEDDSHGNLVATRNLFSKIQEVRKLGNSIYEGVANISCPPPLLEFPAAPESLDASISGAAVSGGLWINPYTVTLNWTDNSSNESGFYIWRSIMKNIGTWSAFSNIASVDADVTTYQDVILESMMSASYKVNSYNLVGTSESSNTASVAITS